MTAEIVVWEFVPDPRAAAGLRTKVRFGVLGVSVLGVAGAWAFAGVAVTAVALAIMVLANLAAHAWARTQVHAGPQRVSADGPRIRFEGTEVYVRGAGGEAFEHIHPDRAEAGSPMVLDDVAWVSVYPAVTRVDGAPAEFHLVVDSGCSDGSRRCWSFDRRIPFRIPGERALADAIADLLDDRWRDVPMDDPFGEVDVRRLADWAM